EEVLLFLYQQDEQRNQRMQDTTATSTREDAQWQLVAGAAGKFIVRGDKAVNQDGMIVETVDTLLHTVATLATTRQAITTPLTTLLQQTALSTQHEAVPAYTMEGQTEKRRWATPHAGVNYYVNINTDQVDEHKAGKESSTLRNAVMAAAEQWSTVDSADFTLRYGGPTTATSTGYNGVSEILFMHKGHKERAAAAEVWYTKDLTVVEADIWINDDYRWDASGTPAFNEVDLESALIHEFGHWLILGHLAQPQSIMYPRLAAGSVKRQLQSEDIAGISAIYPR
ncbi:MAG: matrixin family metalloprotease, partial [Caldilineaceae bacterium]|nr:matrixin family metalloprotease [Caldilineaceae bacterium]